MSSFRFHKFTDEEDKDNNYYNFNDSNVSGNQKKFFNNDLTKSYNNQTLKNSIYNTQSNYMNNNNNNFINSNSNIKISINYNNSNKLINLNSSYNQNNINQRNFPFDEIKSLDFLLLLRNGRFNSIEKYLPQMLYYDFFFG